MIKKRSRNNLLLGAISLYLLATLTYMFAADYGDLWSLLYYTKDNLFIAIIAYCLRGRFKAKIIPDMIVLAKLYSTLSITLRLLFDVRVLGTYAYCFISILAIPLIVYEWQQINKNQIAKFITGLVMVSFGALVSWKLSEYSENNRRVEQLIRELEQKKASKVYVDKENNKQDERNEKRFDKIDHKLDYIIERIDKFTSR